MVLIIRVYENHIVVKSLVLHFEDQHGREGISLSIAVGFHALVSKHELVLSIRAKHLIQDYFFSEGGGDHVLEMEEVQYDLILPALSALCIHCEFILYKSKVV